LANLRQPETVLQPAANRVLLHATPVPVVTPRPPAAGVQREHHVAELRLAHDVPADAEPRALRHGDVPPDRFRIEPQARGNALLRHAIPPEAEYFGDFNHRDLAIHPRPPATGKPGTGDRYRAVRRGGKGFEKLSAQRGK